MSEAKEITQSHDQLARQFAYLDSLRESGATNMYGARPYLMRAFKKLSEAEAALVLSAWMKTFSRETSPADRATAAMAKATA